MSAWEVLHQPMFRVTNLRRELTDCYTTLGCGFALGFIVAMLIWR